MMEPHSCCTCARWGLAATFPHGAVVLAPAQGSPYTKDTGDTEEPTYSSATLGARTAYCRPPRKVTKLVGAQFSSAFQVEVLPAVLYSEKRSPNSRFRDLTAGRSFNTGTSSSA